MIFAKRPTQISGYFQGPVIVSFGVSSQMTWISWSKSSGIAGLSAIAANLDFGNIDVE